MKLTIDQKKILQDLLQQILEKRDGKRCLKCGRLDRLSKSHIYPKGRYRRLEYDPDNLKLLCYNCHINWWHKNPIEAHKWIKTKISKKRLERLDFIANKDRSRWSMDFKIEKLYLENCLNKYCKDCRERDGGNKK